MLALYLLSLYAFGASQNWLDWREIAGSSVTIWNSAWVDKMNLNWYNVHLWSCSSSESGWVIIFAAMANCIWLLSYLGICTFNWIAFLLHFQPRSLLGFLHVGWTWHRWNFNRSQFISIQLLWVPHPLGRAKGNLLAASYWRSFFHQQTLATIEIWTIIWDVPFPRLLFHSPIRLKPPQNIWD